MDDPPAKKRKMNFTLSGSENSFQGIPGENKPYCAYGSDINKKDDKKSLSVEELLLPPFPFGKCQNMPVGVVCLKSYYLAALYDKNTYWQVHPLRELLVSAGILIEKGRKLNPDFYLRCQQIGNKYRPNIPNPFPFKSGAEQENTSSEQRSCCVLCLELFPLSSGVRYSWMPCGHSNLCQNCYFSKQLDLRQISHCPTCRAKLSLVQPLKQMFV